MPPACCGGRVAHKQFCWNKQDCSSAEKLFYSAVLRYTKDLFYAILL
jgi:hypothetical protein